MATTYTLVINGKPQGPFSIDELKAHNLQPGDFVKTDGIDDYKEVHEIAELRTLFGFAEQPVIPQYFGSFDQRLLASVLDWFFVSGACLIVAFIISAFTSDKITLLRIALSLFLVVPLVKLVYHVIMESSGKQATYGKQILRIKVCDMLGRRINFGRAATRNLAKVLSVITLFIGYLFSFFTPQQQCLHDMVAGTLVMKDRLL